MEQKDVGPNGNSEEQGEQFNAGPSKGGGT